MKQHENTTVNPLNRRIASALNKPTWQISREVEDLISAPASIFLSINQILKWSWRENTDEFIIPSVSASAQTCFDKTHMPGIPQHHWGCIANRPLVILCLPRGSIYFYIHNTSCSSHCESGRTIQHLKTTSIYTHKFVVCYPKRP